MVQTYQGYFQEGRFVSPQANSIPENVEVYVLVTNKAVLVEKTLVEKQREAFEKFVNVIENSEPLGADFDEVMSVGIRMNREIEL